MRTITALTLAALTALGGCAINSTVNSNNYCPPSRQPRPARPAQCGNMWAERQEGCDNLLYLAFVVSNDSGPCPSQVRASLNTQIRQAYFSLFKQAGVCTNVLTREQWDRIVCSGMRDVMTKYEVVKGKVVKVNPEVEPVQDGSPNGAYKIHP